VVEKVIMLALEVLAPPEVVVAMGVRLQGEPQLQLVKVMMAASAELYPHQTIHAVVVVVLVELVALLCQRQVVMVVQDYLLQ
jgi:hypothetical protein